MAPAGNASGCCMHGNVKIARVESADFPPDRALVLANLGTPDAPTPAAVRTWLRAFLRDPRVVGLPRALWWPLLEGVILPRRSAPVARKYAEIWMEGGSPLAVHTHALADAVQQRLRGWIVVPAMRHGAPSLAATLRELHERGLREIRVLPLFPQYSTTTTASVDDVVSAARRDLGARILTLHDYHADPGWVQAVAAGIRAHWAAHGRGDALVLSFHGIPEALVRKGDPYAAQCEASTQAIATALGLARSDVRLAFQSRFGRARWLQPYTLPTLQGLARDGVRTVDVACPGFAVDCLETLEEIMQLNAGAFRDAGGAALRYIPCLNAGDAHADALAALATRDWT